MPLNINELINEKTKQVQEKREVIVQEIQEYIPLFNVQNKAYVLNNVIADAVYFNEADRPIPTILIFDESEKESIKKEEKNNLIKSVENIML
jgi:hypothetical protein